MIDVTLISAKDVVFEAESGSMSQKVGQENSSDCPQFSDILAESVDSRQASDTKIGEDLNAGQAVNNQLDNNQDEGIKADYANIQDLAASVQAIAMQVAQRIQMDQQTISDSLAKQETSEGGFMPISGVGLDMQVDSSSEAVVQSFSWQQVSSKTSQPQMNFDSADSKADSETGASQIVDMKFKNNDGIDNAGLNSQEVKLGHKLHSNWKGDVPQGLEEKIGGDAAVD